VTLSPRTIAVWQIAGGALILVANAIALAQTDLSMYGTLAVPTSVGIGVLAIVASTRLWRGQRGGVTLSLVSQCLQLAWMSLPSVQFGSVLGPTVGFRLTATEALFSVGFSGQGGLYFAPIASGTHLPVDIKVNVLAFVAIYSLIENQRLTTTSPRRHL